MGADLLLDLASVAEADARVIAVAAQPPPDLAWLGDQLRRVYGDDGGPFWLAHEIDPARRQAVLCARHRDQEHVRLRRLAARLRAEAAERGAAARA